MFSNVQKAADKARLFLQNITLAALKFQKQIHMAKDSSPKVQAVYELCKESFTPSAAPLASSQVIQKLCSLLGISPFSFLVAFGIPERNVSLAVFSCFELIFLDFMR